MKRFLKWSLIIICILLLILLVGYTAVRVTGSSAWERELARWEAIGGVTKYVDLLPDPVADEVNAALLYQQAGELIENIGKLDGPEFDDPWSDECDLAAALSKYGEVLGLIHEAAGKKECVWPAPAEPLDINSYVDVISKRSSLLRALAKLVRVEAVYYASQGDYIKANQAIETGFKLSADGLANKILINVLVSIAIDSLMLDTFQRIYIDREYGDSESVKAILDIVSINKRELLVKPMFLEEGTFGIEMLFSTLTINQPQHTLSFLFKHDAAEYLKLMRMAIDKFSVPYAEQDHTVPLPDPPVWAILTKALVPALERFNENIVYDEVKYGLAQQAILLRQYKFENGSYPEPGTGTDKFEIMIDPFDGMPFDYEIHGEGFILKSRAAMNNKGQLVWQWDK